MGILQWHLCHFHTYFSSKIAYWHALLMACPKHAPTYGDVSCHGSQLTTWKMVNSKIFKLLPSSFMYVTIFFVNWYCVNKGFTISANVAPVMLSASNNPIVTWWGYQVPSMKFTIKKNVSYRVLDIQRSKLIFAFHIWLIKITHTYPLFLLSCEEGVLK